MSRKSREIDEPAEPEKFVVIRSRKGLTYMTLKQASPLSQWGGCKITICNDEQEAIQEAKS